MSEQPTSPGWYEDPNTPEQLRYFDGILWTEHTTPRRTRWESSSLGAEDGGAAGRDQPGGRPPAVPPSGGQYPSSWPSQPGPRRYGRDAAGPTTADGVALAGYLPRVLAFVIDWIITMVLGTVLGGWFLWNALANYPEIFSEIARTGDLAALNRLVVDPSWMLGYQLVAFAVGLGYHTYFLHRSGQTPGKMALGISARLAIHPGALSWRDSLLRAVLRPSLSLVALIPVIGIVAVVTGVLDLLLPAVDAKRQTLHDKIARTQVVVGKQPARGTTLQDQLGGR